MTAAERRLILGCCAAALLAFAYGGWQGMHERKADAAMVSADELHVTAAVATGKAEVYDEQIKTDQPKTDASAATTKRLRAELAALRITPDAPDASDSSAPIGAPIAPVPDLGPVVAKQRELISAQETRITLLEGNVSTLTLSRDAWRTSAQASAQEAVQLRAVIAAQQGLIAGALLKGRLQGLAVGLGSGYVAGGLR